MIRLTVFYNLHPGEDEAEFLEWRLGPHQQANVSIPGVVRTDFARITDTYPPGEAPKYRFMTIAEWDDKAAFEAYFYAPEAQAGLAESLKRVADPLMLISEVLLEADLRQ